MFLKIHIYEILRARSGELRIFRVTHVAMETIASSCLRHEMSSDFADPRY
jgi:hypothetical protein